MVSLLQFSCMDMKDLSNLEEFRTRQLTEQELAFLNSQMTKFDNFIGLQYTAFGPEKMTATIEVGPHLHQPADLVNGGVFCSIGESMGSFAGYLAAGAPVVGMNNSTDLIRSVQSGVIEAEATPVHVGGRTQIWRIEMRHEGKLAAVTTLRTMVMR